ncbi:MAG: hypothetical protein E7560_05040 [Ruminococcaceae bacterium]|nr:hypothetical protein [Oscillospiraceae bacterium]
MKNSKILKCLVMIFALALFVTSLAACNENPSDSSSVESDITSSETDVSSTETVTSEETETETKTEEAPVITESTPTPSTNKPAKTESTPSSVTPPESKPQVTQPDPEPQPEPVKKTPQELIVGKWECMFDFGPVFEEMGYDIGDVREIKTSMEFTSTGTVIQSMDSASFKSILKPVLEQAFQQSMLENNVTQQELEAQLGMTLNEYIEQVLQLFDQGFNAVGNYKFVSDTLLVEASAGAGFMETPYSFIDDNTLKITDTDGEKTFKRVG